MNANAALTNAIYLLACVGVVWSIVTLIAIALPLIDRARRWF